MIVRIGSRVDLLIGTHSYGQSPSRGSNIAAGHLNDRSPH